MSPRHALSLLILVASLGVVAAACTSGGQPIDLGEGDDDDIVYNTTFGNTGAFAAMANEDCGRAGACHAAIGSSDMQLPDITGNASLSSGLAYTEIMSQTLPAVIDTANDAQSLLLTKGAGTVTHGGSNVWAEGDATYQAVLGWITAGAQNN